MQKKIKIAFSSALLMVAAAGSMGAHASDSAQLIVQGRITDVTCDVGLTGTPKTGILDLGTHKPADFTSATAVVGGKSFGVGLTNCSGDKVATKHVGVTVSGSAMSGHPDVFSDNPGQSVGVNLVSGASAVKPGDFVATTADADMTGTVNIPFTAGLIYPSWATSTKPAAQDVQATLQFVSDYQ